jgi:hypothetical protein
MNSQIEQLSSDERIAKLESKLEATQYVLNQLLHGLFNNRTQKDVLDRYVDDLFQINKLDIPLREAPMLHVSPSTRQGDVLEFRMNKIEERILSIQKDCLEDIQKVLQDV